MRAALTHPVRLRLVGVVVVTALAVSAGSGGGGDAAIDKTTTTAEAVTTTTASVTTTTAEATTTTTEAPDGEIPGGQQRMGAKTIFLDGFIGMEVADGLMDRRREDEAGVPSSQRSCR